MIIMKYCWVFKMQDSQWQSVLLRHFLIFDIWGDKKSSYVKDWFGSSWVQSPGECDDLDANNYRTKVRCSLFNLFFFKSW